MISNYPYSYLFKDADFVLLNETMNTNYITLKDYYTFNQMAKGRPFGGLTVYIKPYLNPELIVQTENIIFTSTSICRFLLCYFNPDTAVDEIVSCLYEVLNKHNFETRPMMIIGDFNCKVDTENIKGNTLVKLSLKLVVVVIPPLFNHT